MVFLVVLVSILSIAVSAISLWGYGTGVTALVAQKGHYSWPVEIGLGLAAVILLGGLLNLTGVAYAASLWAVLAVGLILAGRNLRPDHFGKFVKIAKDTEFAWVGLVISGITVFAIVTQVSPSAFNFHDDFHKYFVHPVRMLATGTLFGSSINGLGSQTLGGQAFLHGFVLSVFPLAYINAVDAVFSFFLLLTIGALAGWRHRILLPTSLVAPLLIAAVNPQYVNVSSLYTGAFLMATACMLAALNTREDPASPVALGLVYAGMTALKTSFALFPALHLPLLVLILWRRNKDVLGSLGYGMKVTIWAAVAIAPWVLVYSTDYLSDRTLPNADVPATSFAPEFGRLFSTKSLFYGGASYLHYTVLVIASCVVFAFLSLYRSQRFFDHLSTGWRESAGAAIVASACVYVLVAAVMTPMLLAPEASLRYTMPVILGALIPSLIVVLSARTYRSNVINAVILVGLLMYLGIFLPSAMQRYQQAWTHGNILAFSLGQNTRYIDRNRFALGETARSNMQEIQSSVPAGAVILAWTGTSFHMDYQRNPIIDVDANSTATGWAHVPPNTQYVLWQYQGFNVRSPKDYQTGIRSSVDKLRLTNFTLAYAFARHLVRLANRSEVVFRDNQYILFRLPEDDELRS